MWDSEITSHGVRGCRHVLKGLCIQNLRIGKQKEWNEPMETTNGREKVS